ncbi:MULTISPECIES: FMN reductase [Methylomonas]|uniref:FMN reductase n=1 Tax=Methylomonas koyamae TaxID=702114 RepID=A0A177NIF5_9GAMM|nr:FMN reductase [Methylomonas koyamae]OAI17828.1 FMN reductase [Methylomonas koyamae]
MSKLNVVVVSGNLGSPSKTLVLAEQILAELELLTPIKSTIFQLAEWAAIFGPARHPGELNDEARKVLQTIASADLLIAVSPVYKGSYTGAFKHLIDFIDPNALVGVPVILAATGGGYKHALVIEHQLRPLFAFFGANALPVGIYAAEQDYDGQRFAEPVVLERISAAAKQAVDAAQTRIHSLQTTQKIA